MNNGLPPAVATTRSTVDACAVAKSDPITSAASVAVRGSSGSVVPPAIPAPQFGRDSKNSGLARARKTIRCSCTCETRYSIRSSSTSSAQWMSSKTNSNGWSSERCSTNRRVANCRWITSLAGSSSPSPSTNDRYRVVSATSDPGNIVATVAASFWRATCTGSFS